MDAFAAGPACAKATARQARIDTNFPQAVVVTIVIASIAGEARGRHVTWGSVPREDLVWTKGEPHECR